MKRNISGLVLVTSILVFTACAQQKKTTAAPKAKAEATQKADEQTITSIVMDRTACFGRCPAYRIEVKADGTATYTSRSDTKYEGVYTKKFSEKAAAALFKQFVDQKVDTCQDKYENKIADLPGMIFEIYYSDMQEPKRIMNAHFGPNYLKTLGKEVDAFSKVDDKWTKVSDSKE
ncbi:MAG: hypothetical protein KDC11_06305 [Chitinophagaceae bacterium]|nr:hypothetical protein [Chitinophagaceae bacterium]